MDAPKTSKEPISKIRQLGLSQAPSPCDSSRQPCLAAHPNASLCDVLRMLRDSIMCLCKCLSLVRGRFPRWDFGYIPLLQTQILPARSQTLHVE
ncbi:hypothetical protein PHSY_004349 [Pseudozyma hubeiensis SY62]|uniref:Uncharacterized protein n=1 Tax=Pseudozyma hubeiensis (strain SY62) TaxID=1305764 RepID=R9PFA8_PSEHS|nr:hypothetical protein PHSY_004349 [Pseudozyma hubeiensis SY62]GAC96765.1 hypothetical protein PHSY_004349 [Pseudozyma hubeiensis SY62]